MAAEKHPDFFEKTFKNKRLFAGLITAVLFVFVAYSTLPFLSAFFGAMLLAYIFNPINKRLKRRFSPAASAWIIVIIALIVVILPAIFIINGLVNQIYLIIDNLDKLEIVNEQINRVIPGLQFDIRNLTNELITGFSTSLTPLFFNFIDYFLILFLIFFLLYYFLLYSDKIVVFIKDNLPFSDKANKEIILKFRQVTDASIVGTFFIAVIQGGLMAFNFYLLGIPNSLFWGFVTAIFSFIPFTGAPLIWGPAVIYFMIKKEVSKAIVMFVVGMMISTIDNILRPVINDRYGSIHPLISIVGIIIGLYQFGIMGIFIGPLLVAYLFLFWKIYREESR
ncbi:MAG: hypothetical protein RL557_302 [archaeon]|jgi:predicted PurR-regulated permease PerM